MVNRWKEIACDLPTNGRRFEPRELRGVAGCYVAYLDDRIAYVGRSNNLCKRIYDHDIRDLYTHIWTPWGVCERLRVKVRESDRMGDEYRREARMIRRLQPLANKKGKGVSVA